MKKHFVSIQRSELQTEKKNVALGGHSVFRPFYDRWHPYGFKEMQEFCKRATMASFTVTFLGLCLALAGYELWLNSLHDAMKGSRIGVVKMRLSNLPPPPTSDNQEIAAPPPPPTNSSGPAARAGTPVPVPDALITPDMKDFANIQEVSRASTKGGDGTDVGYLGLASDDVKIEVREEDLPDPYQFVPVEKEPYVDIKYLQSKVVYPEVARRANIQGKVLLRVLIGKNGVPKKWIVESTDSDLLNEASINAVKSVVFTPAIQNNYPIDCWVSLPIVFIIR